MTNKTAAEYLKEPYARIVVPDSTGGYYAEMLEFPGCLTSGETPEEAYKNLESVATEWIQAELEEGHEIPQPSSSEAFSGKFPLRMPRSLHQQAARMAEREGTSLNQYIVAAIAGKTGADDVLRRVTEEIAQSVLITATIKFEGIAAMSQSERSLIWSNVPARTRASRGHDLVGISRSHT